MCLCRFSVIQVIVIQVSISLCYWTTGLEITSPVTQLDQNMDKTNVLFLSFCMKCSNENS